MVNAAIETAQKSYSAKIKQMNFRKLHRSEIKRGMEAIDRLWGKNHILARDAALFEWQYGNNQDAETFSFVIAEQAGEIVGFSGMIVLPWHLHGLALKGGSGALTIMAPQWRTGKNGFTLLEEADKEYEIVGGIGINKRVAKLFALQGRYVADAFPRFVTLANPDLANDCLLKAAYPEVQRNLCLQKCSRLIKRAPEPAYKLAPFSEENGQKWQKVWKNFFEPRLTGVARNLSYLKWRYLNHPSFAYEIFFLLDQNDDPAGLLIFRQIPLDNGLVVVRVMDFLAKNDEASEALAFSLSELIPDNCAWCEFYCFGDFGEALKSIGFNMEGSDLLSVWTSPPDSAHCKIPLSFNIRTQNKIASNLAYRKDLYLTISDGDQDRPH